MVYYLTIWSFLYLEYLWVFLEYQKILSHDYLSSRRMAFEETACNFWPTNWLIKVDFTALRRSNISILQICLGPRPRGTSISSEASNSLNSIEVVTLNLEFKYSDWFFFFLTFKEYLTRRPVFSFWRLKVLFWIFSNLNSSSLFIYKKECSFFNKCWYKYSFGQKRR